MDSRFKKRFLLSIIALFVGAFVISLAIVFGLQARGLASYPLSTGTSWLIVFALSLVPVSLFNGFVTMLIKINEMDKRQSTIFVLLVLPMAILALPVGLIMLAPNVIRVAFSKGD